MVKKTDITAVRGQLENLTNLFLESSALKENLKTRTKAADNVSKDYAISVGTDSLVAFIDACYKNPQSKMEEDIKNFLELLLSLREKAALEELKKVDIDYYLTFHKILFNISEFINYLKSITESLLYDLDYPEDNLDKFLPAILAQVADMCSIQKTLKEIDESYYDGELETGQYLVAKYHDSDFQGELRKAKITLFSSTNDWIELHLSSNTDNTFEKAYISKDQLITKKMLYNIFHKSFDGNTENAIKKSYYLIITRL